MGAPHLEVGISTLQTNLTMLSSSTRPTRLPHPLSRRGKRKDGPAWPIGLLLLPRALHPKRGRGAILNVIESRSGVVKHNYSEAGKSTREPPSAPAPALRRRPRRLRPTQGRAGPAEDLCPGRRPQPSPGPSTHRVKMLPTASSRVPAMTDTSDQTQPGATGTGSASGRQMGVNC